MLDKLNNFTFIADPLTYQASPHEVCVLVPAGIATTEELLASLAASLPLPERELPDWNSLYDVLRAWDEWQTTPQRVAIVHSDLPLISAGRAGFFELQSYLEILRDSISALQTKKTASLDSRMHWELVAIFPGQMEEEVRQVLDSPPAWDLTQGFFADDDFSVLHRDPSWSTVLRALGDLNGITSEICTLARADVGRMLLHYNKHTRAYCALYEAPDREAWLVASESEELTPPHPISFALASQVMEDFFTRGERSDALHWSHLSASACNDLLNKLQNAYYRNDEELLVEKHMHRARALIGRGVEEALRKEQEGHSLTYWQAVLVQPAAPLSQCLAALCVIGLSTLPEAPALLRPFLQSPVKQERWVSARFCGLWHDEDSLPVLLKMLTDELPLREQKSTRADDYSWYNVWRNYAPRILHQWQTPEVGQQLQRALALWVQTEPQFDPDDKLWELCEGELCYELGYRGAASILSEFPLKGEHKQALSFQVGQGRQAQQQYRHAQKNRT